MTKGPAQTFLSLIPQPLAAFMSKPPVFLFYLSLFAIGACGNSPSGSNNSGGGGTPPTIDFAGPTDAAPASYTSIAVQWNAAVVTNPLPGIIYYDVYRAESAGMASEILAATISDGALSMVDSGLADDTTYFYRVLARTDEVASDNADVVSANLPATVPTGMEYATTVEPLWSRLDDTGTYTCLTCHDSNASIAKMDLTSWEGLVIGIGTAAKPKSFVIPTFGKQSLLNALTRIQDHSLSLAYHKLWRSQAAAFQAGLMPWIDEGATEFPDTTAPEFNPVDLADASLHFLTQNGANKVTLNFPHASDPESEPFLNLAADHLEYHVFVGLDSNSIDWGTPAAKVKRLYFKNENATFAVNVNWAHNTGVFWCAHWTCAITSA